MCTLVYAQFARRDEKMFNIRWLVCFRRVVMDGSAAGAARSLNISQSAVSRAVSSLEHELRFELFHRTRQKLHLTQEGRAFFDEVERILANLDDVPRIAQRIRTRNKRTLRIVAMPRTANRIVGPAVSRFSQLHRDVHIYIDVISRHLLETWVADRQYDIGFGALPTTHDAIETVPIVRARALVVLPQGHQLGKKSQVNVEDLVGERMITTSSGLLPRDQMDDIFRSAGVRPNYVIESSSSVMTCQLVSHGAGLTVVDALLADSVRGESVVTRPLKAEHWMIFGLIRPKGYLQQTMVEEFVSVLTEELRGRVEPGILELI